MAENYNVSWNGLAISEQELSHIKALPYGARAIADGGLLIHNEAGRMHSFAGRPAWRGASGDKQWRFENILHRTDGPAIVSSGGLEDFYLAGVKYPKNEWEKEVLKWRHLTEVETKLALEGKKFTCMGSAIEWRNTNGQFEDPAPGVPARRDTNTGAYEHWHLGRLHSMRGPATKNVWSETYAIHGQIVSAAKHQDYVRELQNGTVAKIERTTNGFFCIGPNGGASCLSQPAIVEGNRWSYWRDGLQHNERGVANNLCEYYLNGRKYANRQSWLRRLRTLTKRSLAKVAEAFAEQPAKPKVVLKPEPAKSSTKPVLKFAAEPEKPKQNLDWSWVPSGSPLVSGTVPAEEKTNSQTLKTEKFEPTAKMAAAALLFSGILAGFQKRKIAKQIKASKIEQKNVKVVVEEPEEVLR